MNMAQILEDAKKEAQAISKTIGKRITTDVVSDSISFVLTVHPDPEPFTDVALAQAKKTKLKVTKIAIEDGEGEEQVVQIIGKGVNWFHIRGAIRQKAEKWINETLANSPNT